jgi:hypothetical protein
MNGPDSFDCDDVNRETRIEGPLSTPWMVLIGRLSRDMKVHHFDDVPAVAWDSRPDSKKGYGLYSRCMIGDIRSTEPWGNILSTMFYFVQYEAVDVGVYVLLYCTRKSHAFEMNGVKTLRYSVLYLRLTGILDPAPITSIGLCGMV